MSLKDRLYKTLLTSKLGISGDDADRAMEAVGDIFREPPLPYATNGLETVLESFHWLLHLMRLKILPLRLPDRARRSEERRVGKECRL